MNELIPSNDCLSEYLFGIISVFNLFSPITPLRRMAFFIIVCIDDKYCAIPETCHDSLDAGRSLPCLFPQELAHP